MLAHVMKWAGVAIIGAGTLVGALTLSGVAVFYQVDADEMVKHAKQEVQRPIDPPRPQGQTRTMVEVIPRRIAVCNNVPKFAGLRLQMEKVCTTQTVTDRVTKEVFVQATTDEMRRWQADVDRIEHEYRRSVAERISTLERQASEERRAWLKDWAQILSVPATLFLGSATLWLGIRRDRREQNTEKEKNDENSADTNALKEATQTEQPRYQG